jgi:hypothetical protein
MNKTEGTSPMLEDRCSISGKYRDFMSANTSVEPTWLPSELLPTALSPAKY